VLRRECAAARGRTEVICVGASAFWTAPSLQKELLYRRSKRIGLLECRIEIAELAGETDLFALAKSGLARNSLFELDDNPARWLRNNGPSKLSSKPSRAGVESIPENGGAAGVRLAKRSKRS
jgi:hypothetical protein